MPSQGCPAVVTEASPRSSIAHLGCLRVTIMGTEEVSEGKCSYIASNENI